MSSGSCIFSAMLAIKCTFIPAQQNSVKVMPDLFFLTSPLHIHLKDIYTPTSYFLFEVICCIYLLKYIDVILKSLLLFIYNETMKFYCMFKTLKHNKRKMIEKKTCILRVASLNVQSGESKYVHLVRKLE